MINEVGSKYNELPTSIIVPDVIGTTAVTGFQAGTFYGNKRLKYLTLPKAVTVIPEAFVRKCINLEYVKNTEQVTHIAKTAFAYSGIKKALFTNLKTIDASAFGMCANLVVVDIGNNITEIPKNAFTQCCDLSFVVGGSKVNVIRESAFYLTRRLRNLPFLTNVTTVETNAFFDSRVNFENVYQTMVDNGCAFGTNATYKQFNTTDYWSEVEYTPCENSLQTLFHQKNPLWADKNIGSTDLKYGVNGCLYCTLAEIYSAFEGVDFNTPEEFISMLEEGGFDIARIRSESEYCATVMSSLGYDVEYVDRLVNSDTGASELPRIYQALKDGALLYKSQGVLGNSSGGHATLVYGINDIGELLISDSDAPVRYIERYDNHLSSMPIYQTGNLEIDIMIVKKQ